MTPESLACETTNTQLEPIRRAIESALPTRPECHFSSYPYEQNRVEKNNLGYKTTYDVLGTNIRPLKTTTSLDNPFLRLSEEEYRTLR